MFLLDTNTLIYHFRGLGNVRENLRIHPPSSIYLSTIVVFELETGIAKSRMPSKSRQLLNALLKGTKLLSFGLKEAQIAGQIRADLEQKGTRIGEYDTLIAATALANGATLVTHNTREFNRVVGLRLEDWY